MVIKKFNTPILVGVAFLVSEILLLSKTTKFPFLSMDYNSPWSSKNLIDWNRLKKFMQVGIDVKYMHTNFSGRALPGFGDIATFKYGQISLSEHGLYSPWSSKNLIDRNQLKKFMQVGIDVKYMHTNFSGRGFSSFGDILRQRERDKEKEEGRERRCTLFTPLLTSFSVFLLHISQSVYTYQSSAYPPTQSHSLMRNPVSQNTLGSGDRKTEKHFKKKEKYIINMHSKIQYYYTVN